MDLRQIGEFGLIRKVKKWMPIRQREVFQGIGDDVAVIKTGDKVLLATTDILIEGIHFKRSWINPYHLGKKSLMVNLSDIAAMGGIPKYFLLSLGLPRNLPVSFVSHFYRGLRDGAKQFHVDLIGGDTSLSQKIVINVCLLGEGKKNEIIYRNGARVGDDLYVSGTLGDAALGLKILQDKGFRRKPKGLIERQLSPCPRIRLGRLLSQRRLANSMIDVSDGLLIDATHLFEESGVGGRILEGCVPRSNLYRRYAALYSKDPYQLALCGGEDYELLFSAPPDRKARILSLAITLGIPITGIGKILPKKEGFRVITKEGKEYLPDCLGFEHFR